MAISRFKIAKKDIESYFESSHQHVFTKKDIGKILDDQRDFWRLSVNLYINGFIENLVSQSKLQKITIHSKEYDKTFTRYIWDNKKSIYQIAISLKPHSYLSHYTAVYLHNLTKQIPTTIYVNTEQSQKPKPSSSRLSQERIDMAFQGKVRTSQYIFDFEDWKICCLSGKNTKNLGVEELQLSEDEKIAVTNIERTLIDIVVRPIYSGGIFEALNAYKEAKGRVSVNTLLAMLKKLNYVYPYHQIIGFYMERAGYKDSLLDLVRKHEIKYNFYLDYKMKETTYIKEWKLFIPKNF